MSESDSGDPRMAATITRRPRPGPKEEAITDERFDGENPGSGGTPESNSMLKRISRKNLPIRWEEGGISSYRWTRNSPRTTYALILICPNPLCINCYVALNSGLSRIANTIT